MKLLELERIHYLFRGRTIEQGKYHDSVWLLGVVNNNINYTGLFVLLEVYVKELVLFVILVGHIIEFIKKNKLYSLLTWTHEYFI